jgi:glycosyltransferase involved in cell wall biosynthesis
MEKNFKMKIALITPYKNYAGGVESVNNILKNIFEEAGHNIEFITTDDFKHNFFTKFMTKVIGLPYITAYRFKNIEKQYDIVIANGEFGWGIHHLKTINLFHGCYKGYRDYLKKLWSKKTYLSLTRDIYIQKSSAKGKYVVCVSEFIKNIFEDDGVKVNQVIANSIDTELFKPNKEIKNDKYLFVGSYNYYAKGFDILEKLADKSFKIDCVTNQKPSSKLGWIENTDNSQMPEIYNKYKILIFPSRFEGIGLVPLEAMACGLPIVMSNVGLGPQLKKIIPEFVVDSYDENEYIKKIQHIEKNYEEYSQKARNYVEEYHSFENYKKQWIELIERVANA